MFSPFLNKRIDFCLLEDSGLSETTNFGLNQVVIKSQTAIISACLSKPLLK